MSKNRNSFDDRLGPAVESPFRSHDESERITAAINMIAKRDNEIIELGQLLNMKQTRQDRRAYQLRLTASKNNRQSWIDYIESGAPRQPRAVVTPYH